MRRSARRSPPRGVLVLLAVAGVLLAATIVARALWPPSPRERLRELRAEIVELRPAADSCREALTAELSRFRAFGDRLDSLRRRIDDFESLDPRGVPADSYRAYLESFEGYNRGVERWHAGAESLRVHWLECRNLAEAHNARADSARALAREIGLLPEPGSSGPPPEH